MLVLGAAILAYFYGFYSLFEKGHYASTFRWLYNCWADPKDDYEHGFLIPLASAFLIFRKRKEIAALPAKPTVMGLVIVVLGIVLFLISARALQPRIAVFSLPVVVVGAGVWLRGWKLGRILFFPSFMILFGVPIPGITQATNQLQIFATQGAYHLVTQLGIDAMIQGNSLFSASDSWGFDVAEGCSGIRSLMALTLIAAVYGYLTQDRLWKWALLFLCAFPLAIVANVFRVASVILVAEYFDPEFAGSLYHDYSGFLFFPVGLFGVIFCSMLINFSKHFRRTSVKMVKRQAGDDVEECSHV